MDFPSGRSPEAPAPKVDAPDLGPLPVRYSEEHQTLCGAFRNVET